MKFFCLSNDIVCTRALTKKVYILVHAYFGFCAEIPLEADPRRSIYLASLSSPGLTSFSAHDENFDDIDITLAGLHKPSSAQGTMEKIKNEIM